MENKHRQRTGYRDLTQEEIDLINEIQAKDKELGDLIIRLRSNPDIDQRWVSIGATDFQTGTMALVRAIARPTI